MSRGEPQLPLRTGDRMFCGPERQPITSIMLQAGGVKSRPRALYASVKQGLTEEGLSDALQFGNEADAMNIDQFSAALRELGISPSRFAAIWGAAPALVSRWLIGAAPFPGWVAPAIASMRAAGWWRSAPDLTKGLVAGGEAFKRHVRLRYDVGQGAETATAYLCPDAPSANPVFDALAYLRAIGRTGGTLASVEEWSADDDRYLVRFNRSIVEAEEFE